MAKAATKTDSDKKKKKVAGKSGRAKTGAKQAKASSPKAKRSSRFDNLAKLVDHPLLADLLAVGAIAAVAAIADHRLGGKDQSSSKVVKTAGKAAAAAIGKKLMGEFGAVAGAATKAAKKA